MLFPPPESQGTLAFSFLELTASSDSDLCRDFRDVFLHTFEAIPLSATSSLQGHQQKGKRKRTEREIFVT